MELIKRLAGPEVADMVVQSANRHIRPESAYEDLKHPTPGGQLNRVVARMEQHIADPIPIPTLAQLAGLSQRSMNRLFFERFQKPPAQYYLSLRLHQAADLIRQTTYSMTDISVSVGFTSASRFSQAFKNYFGKSPSEMRKLASWMQVTREQTQSAKLLRTSDDI